MLRLLLIALLFATGARAETLPWNASQPGYHAATLELAEFCLENKLFSEAQRIVASVDADRAREIVARADGQADAYTSQAWGDYLDRVEAVQRGRAAGAHAAGQSAERCLVIDPGFAAAREALGFKWLDGVGWLAAEEHERLGAQVVALAEAPAKQQREATWDAPWVVVGARFTLVTDLPWARARKYAQFLERFDGVFFETLGDIIPRRDQPNVVWCCREASTFVEVTQAAGFPLSAESSGLHVGALGAVFINAERCDYVGRRNKSWDNLARTLFHECAHRLVEVGLRGIRGGMDRWALSASKEHAWIVESIAIVFEDLRFERNSHRLAGLEDQRTYTIDQHWKGKDGRVPELAPIFAQGQAAFATGEPISNAEKYALAGGVGWYCMFEQKEYRNAYLYLLVDYYRADTQRRDFKQRFDKPLKEFEVEWKAWILT